MKAPAAAALVAFMVCLLAAVNISAATLVVTKTEDTNDGVCDADCSLREAVAAAAADDTVIFSSLFNSPQTITLTLGQVAITRSLTLSGPGRDLLSISGNDMSRIFHISGGPMVNISGMKLTNGRAASPNLGQGGAVYISDSSANLTGVDVANNLAPPLGGGSGAGGGIYVLRGTLTVLNSTVSSNIAVVVDVGAGGGIYGMFSQINVADSSISFNQPQGIRALGGNPLAINVNNCSISNNSGTGISAASANTSITDSLVRGNSAGVTDDDSAHTLTIDRSVISENQPFGGIANSGTAIITNTSIKDNFRSGTNGFGGGIANVGTMYILNSSITGNRAFQSGGGIWGGGGQNTYVTNSTVSGNIANGTNSSLGGGIHAYGSSANVVVTNSTIAQNNATGLGGGICSDNSNRVTLRNTIIAGNSSSTSSVDVAGTIISNGTNLIGTTTGSSGWITSDLVDRDPLLAPLANNGGIRLTHAILPTSPAINAGNNDLARDPYDNSFLTFDERGKGFLRVANAAVDIGAYEANYAAGPVNLGGRVLVSPNGRGIPRAYVTLTDVFGNVAYTQTNPFGNYRFLNLSPGTTYIVRVSNKSYIFDSPQVVTIDQPRDNLDFVALGQ